MTKYKRAALYAAAGLSWLACLCLLYHLYRAYDNAFEIGFSVVTWLVIFPPLYVCLYPSSEHTPTEKRSLIRLAQFLNVLLYAFLVGALVHNPYRLSGWFFLFSSIYFFAVVFRETRGYPARTVPQLAQGALLLYLACLLFSAGFLALVRPVPLAQAQETAKRFRPELSFVCHLQDAPDEPLGVYLFTDGAGNNYCVSVKTGEIEPETPESAPA